MFTHNYTEKDFSGCVFNPLVKKQMVKMYPDLQGVIAVEREDSDALIRYIIAMYDQYSPLTKAFPELKQRKQVAAAVAGLEGKEEYFDFLFGNKDQAVIEGIGYYLRSFGSPKVWMMIVSQEQMFHEYFDRIMKPVDADKDTDIIRGVDLKSKLAAEMDLISTRLDTYYRKLYGEDEDLLAQSRVSRVTPETIAKQIKKHV